MSSDWRSYQFQELCDIKRGASPRPIHDYLGDEGMPWIKIADATAEDSRFIRTSKERIKLSGVKASVEVFPGELILSNSATPGLPKFMKINACIHDGWMILRNFKQLDKNFAYWLLLVERTNLVSQGNGSVFTNLKTDILKNYTVNIPAIDEQIRIASFFNTLDDRITLLRETNKTLEAIAQAIFKSWFVDFDPVRAKQEGREPEGMDADTAALFPDSFEESELGLIPKGWPICSVYDLAQYINGAAYKAFEPNLERRGLPIIKIAELKAGVTSQTGFSDIKMPLKYKINTQDVLFSWSGNPDTSIDIFVWPHGEAWLNQHIFRVVPKTAQERSFILLTLKYLKPVFAEIARNKQTTGLGHVTVSDLKRLRVIQPNNLLLKKWNELVDPLLERAFMIEQKAGTLTQLRDTLLPRLISGQLRLPDAESMLEEAVL